MDMSIKYVNSERPCNKSVACLLPSVEDAGVAPTVSSSTPGRHPARRLVEVGIRSVFSVPGDSNFTLLVEPGLNLSGCCNELNAGYAADGCTVTFTVRGLGVTSGAYSENLPVTCSVGGPNSSDYGTNGIAISGAYRENLPVTCSVGRPNSSGYGTNGIAISGTYRENLAVTCSVGWPHSSDYGTNGIAISGAYSENLPVTCSVGGPNSSDHGTNGILHHTIALPGFSLEYRRFQTVTWIQVIVNHLDDAHKLTGYNISIALMESEHVYISISCNLAAVQHPAFSRQFVPYALSPRSGSLVGVEGLSETKSTNQYMSNFQPGRQNLGGNNNMVDNRHNSGDKNVIGANNMIFGNPIVGNNSGNKINSCNKINTGNDDAVNSNNKVNTGNNDTVNSNKKVKTGNLCHQINNAVDNKHNIGHNNSRNTQIDGNPIVDDNSGNEINISNNNRVNIGNVCHQINKTVDNKHNGADKNGIGPNTQIDGNPIVGDNNGNTININNMTVNIGNVCDQMIFCAAGRPEQQHGRRHAHQRRKKRDRPQHLDRRQDNTGNKNKVWPATYATS